MIDRPTFAAALDQIVQGWNGGDRSQFLAGYLRLGASGLHLENPVGGPVQSGWGVLEKLYDDYQTHVRVQTERFIVNGGEAVAVMHNEHIASGETTISVETYRMDDDGALLVRYFNPNA